MIWCRFRNGTHGPTVTIDRTCLLQIADEERVGFVHYVLIGSTLDFRRLKLRYSTWDVSIYGEKQDMSSASIKIDCGRKHLRSETQCHRRLPPHNSPREHRHRPHTPHTTPVSVHVVLHWTSCQVMVRSPLFWAQFANATTQHE